LEHFSHLGKLLIFCIALLPIFLPSTYAQSVSADSLQMQENTEDYMTTVVLTGSPIVFDTPHQPIPIIANGSDYRFNIAFMAQDNTTSMLKNVDYNIVILIDGKEVFNAQNQSSSPSAPLHTSTGNATLNYKFEKIGSASVRISILGVDSKVVNNSSADYHFQVDDSRKVPEFPIALLIGGIGISATLFAIRLRGHTPAP
jgi:hypothetical protein